MTEPDAARAEAAALRERMNAEIARTAFQRKAVSRLPESEITALVTAFFRDRGYRTGRTGRPGQIFVMGGREGELPRVTGEINIQVNVGKAKATVVRMDAAGERLGPTMADFYQELRARRRAD